MSGCRSCSGRPFHSVGPAVAKQRSPNWLRDLLTKHVRLSADRRGRRPVAVTSVTVSHCSAALRQLRHPRRYVTNDCFRSLVASLVHSKLDYGNFVLVGLPVYLQRRLQSVLNSAARLVFRLRRYDRVTDALGTLHWLRPPQRVDFKVAVMAFQVLRALAPPYLN